MTVRFAHFPALALVVLILPLAGCHSHVFSKTVEQAHAEQRAEESMDRQELDQIPPPSKGRFMAIHSVKSWENPAIVVQPGMLELHVTVGDANPSTFGAGGMLRPVGAREQELNISLDKLEEAISSVPASAWPYGRVVALDEPTRTPASAEPQVRRNMEVALRELNNLGIVAYDLRDGMVR